MNVLILVPFVSAPLELGDKRTHGRRFAPMSAARSGKSRALRWAAGLMLYVLAAGPAFSLESRTCIKGVLSAVRIPFIPVLVLSPLPAWRNYVSWWADRFYGEHTRGQPHFSRY